MARMLDLIPRRGTFSPARDLFYDFFEDWGFPSLFSEEKSWVPAFDVVEDEKAFVVTAEIPGIDMKDLDVSLSDGILTVKGEKKNEEEEKRENYHRIERRYGSFHRSFRIPGEIDTDKLDATYKDGILKLVMPKGEASKPKKIKVK